MTVSNLKKSFACLILNIVIALNVLASPLEQVSENEATNFHNSQRILKNFANRASEIVLNALSLIGIRYKWGGETPERGMDCSGFVNYVFEETFGSSLPRTALGLSRIGIRIERRDLQPGDLVFYNTRRRSYSHVGIYLGDNKFIHSPSKGGFVRIDSMNESYWKKRFDGARRIEGKEKIDL